MKKKSIGSYRKKQILENISDIYMKKNESKNNKLLKNQDTGQMFKQSKKNNNKEVKNDEQLLFIKILPLLSKKIFSNKHRNKKK